MNNKIGKLNKKTARDPARLPMTLLPRSRSAQEEMVGFGIIVIIVSVVLLVLLGFLLRTPDKGNTENYEVESFIQSALQYTTACETEIDFLSVQDLIVSCEEGDMCLNEENSCNVLNDTLKNLVKSAWNVNNKSAVKGYKFSGMIDENREMFMLKEGNETKNYIGGFQDFSKGGNNYEIFLSVYS